MVLGDPRTYDIQYRTPNKKQESELSLDFLFFIFMSLFLIEPLSYFRRAEIVLILILVGVHSY